MFRVRQFITLTILTALEAMRQPICLLLAVTCIILTALVPLTIMHNFGEDGKLVRDSGLALHFVFGLFLAGYAASSSLSGEMKSGTASAVLCKPVSRDIYFLAKFTGIACLVLLFSICAASATLLSERAAEKYYSTNQLTGWHSDIRTGIMLACAPFLALLSGGLINYKLKRPFESTAFALLLLFLLLVFFIVGFFNVNGAFAPFDFRVQWRILSASLLITIALIVLSAVAMMLSTRLSTAPTLIFSAAVFLIGLMSDYLFGRYADTSHVSALIYRILPNWQHFWASDALSNGGTVPALYILNAGVYALIYLTGILCLGILSFRYAEMK